MILNEIREIDDICNRHISDFGVYCTETPKIFTTSLCFYTDIATRNKILSINDLLRLVSTSSNGTYMSKYKYFKNCVLFKFNKTSIKVFTNGTVHVTGAKTICGAYNIIKHVFDDLFKDGDQYDIIRYSIFMMNISLKIKTDHLDLDFDLDILYERFASMGIPTYYDKNKHAALKIKFPQTKMSILLFSSGSVLIMGNKNTNDIKTMLDWLKENLKLTF